MLKNLDDSARKILLIISISIVSIVVIFGVVLFFITGGNFGNSGTFGDSFGVLNSIFTGLAFTGTVFALLSAQNQIKSQEEQGIRQQEQMKLQQEQMSSQQDQLKLQRDQLKLQQFEFQFERLLNALEVESQNISVEIVYDYLKSSEKERDLQDDDYFDYQYHYDIYNDDVEYIINLVERIISYLIQNNDVVNTEDYQFILENQLNKHHKILIASHAYYQEKFNEAGFLFKNIRKTILFGVKVSNSPLKKNEDIELVKLFDRLFRELTDHDNFNTLDSPDELS